MTEKTYENPEKPWRYGFTDDMEGHGKLYKQGSATKQSALPDNNEGCERVKRPLADRVERAEDYWSVVNKKNELENEEINGNSERVSILKAEIDSIINTAKKRDKIYSAFLKPKPISVDMGELGIQKAQYVDIKTEFTDPNKDPMVIVMGFGNNLNGLGGFSQRIAMETNQKVIMISQPDSLGGIVTNAFGKAVRKSKNFGPHTEFFKLAIKEILEEKNIDKFDICGVSAGAIMVSEIIKDKEFSGRIMKKNLIFPPGITKLTLLDIPKRLKLLKKTMGEQRKKGNLPKLMVTNIETIQKKKEQLKAQKKSFLAITLKLIQKYPWWNGLRDTNVVIADEDTVTYGIKNIDEVKSNPNLSIHVVSGGHELWGTEPERVIEKMVF